MMRKLIHVYSIDHMGKHLQLNLNDQHRSTCQIPLPDDLAEEAVERVQHDICAFIESVVRSEFEQ